jgi:hypothetical protein
VIWPHQPLDGKPSNLPLYQYNTYLLTTRFLRIPMDYYDPVAIIELVVMRRRPRGEAEHEYRTIPNLSAGKCAVVKNQPGRS